MRTRHAAQKGPQKIKKKERKEIKDWFWLKATLHLKQRDQTASGHGAVTAEQFAKGHSPWASAWHRSATAKRCAHIVLYDMTLFFHHVKGWSNTAPHGCAGLAGLSSSLNREQCMGGGGWKAPSSTQASRRDFSPRLSFPQTEHFYTSCWRHMEFICGVRRWNAGSGWRPNTC